MVKIRKIAQKDAHHFTILWSDERKSVYRLSKLQLCCPCAHCLEKRKTEQPLAVNPQVSARRIVSVGRYALRVEFTEGCSQGIYTFSFLREIEGTSR